MATDAHGEPLAVTVRSARPHDASTIAALHEAAVHGERGRGDYDDRQIDAWARSPGPADLADRIRTRHFLLAEAGAAAVGYAQLDVDASTVRSVYVNPSGQRRGTGRRLVHAVLDAARDARLDRLELDASLNAAGFYEKLGFRQTGQVEHRFRSGVTMPCIRMAKEL